MNSKLRRNFAYFTNKCRRNTDAITTQPSFGNVVLIVWYCNAITDAQHVQQIQVTVILLAHTTTTHSV